MQITIILLFSIIFLFSITIISAYSLGSMEKEIFRGIELKPGDRNLIYLSRHETNDLFPSWSPDGTKIIFERHGTIHMVNAVDGSELRRLISGNNCYPQWSPDGEYIVFIHSCQKKFQLHMMNDEGQEVIQLSDRNLENYPSWSPDGKQIVFTAKEKRIGNERLFIMNIDGTNRIQISQDDGFRYLHPDWSNDGTRIVAVVSEIPRKFDIIIMNTDGSNREILTSLTSKSFFPKWSPDDEKILFVDEIDGDQDVIAVMNNDGSNKMVLAKGQHRDLSADWSPDGKKIVFSDKRGKVWDLHTMNSDGTNQTRLAAYSQDFVYPELPPDPFSPPQKLLKIGFSSKEIRCNSNLILTFNIHGKPACVKEKSLREMTERGWIPRNKSICYNPSFDTLIKEKYHFGKYEELESAIHPNYTLSIDIKIFPFKEKSEFFTWVLEDCQNNRITEHYVDKYVTMFGMEGVSYDFLLKMVSHEYVEKIEIVNFTATEKISRFSIWE